MTASWIDLVCSIPLPFLLTSGTFSAGGKPFSRFDNNSIFIMGKTNWAYLSPEIWDRPGKKKKKTDK